MNAAWRLEVNDDFVEAGSVDLRFLYCNRCSYGVGHFFIRRFWDCCKTLGMDGSLRNYMARLLHFGVAYFSCENSFSNLPLVEMSYLPQELETFSIYPHTRLAREWGTPGLCAPPVRRTWHIPISSCKKPEIMASSIIFLRKDAHIGGFQKHNAKRATSANNVAGLL